MERIAEVDMTDVVNERRGGKLAVKDGGSKTGEEGMHMDVDLAV